MHLSECQNEGLPADSQQLRRGALAQAPHPRHRVHRGVPHPAPQHAPLPHRHRHVWRAGGEDDGGQRRRRGRRHQEVVRVIILT